MKQPCSLVIATYNWPQALELCLKSVLQQTKLPQEIIIADDGSREDTTKIVNNFGAKSPVPVIHVWHPDEGFRLAKIRNRAIAKSSQPYIIQIDGDLILDRHFIADHMDLHEPGYFISGSRVLLSAQTTGSLFSHRSIDLRQFEQGSRNVFNKLRSRPLRNLMAKRYKTRGKNMYCVKGCNMAFWRSDILKVNGYNEAFTSWGGEDNELITRLINAGIRKKSLKMGGISYHLYHDETCRDLGSENVQLMEEAISGKTVFASKGISSYL